MKKTLSFIALTFSLSVCADCQTSYDSLYNNYTSYLDSWNQLTEYLQIQRSSDEYHEKYLDILNSGNEYGRQAADFNRTCGENIQDQNHIPDIINNIKDIKTYSSCILFEERNLSFIKEMAEVDYITDTDKAKAKGILAVYNKRLAQFISQCQFYHDNYEQVTLDIMHELKRIGQ